MHSSARLIVAYIFTHVTTQLIEKSGYLAADASHHVGKGTATIARLGADR